MRRMGRATSDATLRYQHGTSDRERARADALDRLAEGQSDNVWPPTAYESAVRSRLLSGPSSRWGEALGGRVVASWAEVAVNGHGEGR
jgi:hypothetical protein